MPDDIDRDIWVSIELNNQLKAVFEWIWEALQTDKHVVIVIGGMIVKEFRGRDIRFAADSGLQLRPWTQPPSSTAGSPRRRRWFTRFLRWTSRHAPRRA